MRGLSGSASHVGNAGHVVSVESFGPGLAAVGGLVHAAIFAGGADAENGMSENSGEDDAGIARVNYNCGDEAGIFQADVGPCSAGIGRAIDAVARGLFAGADDDDFGIGGGDGDVADGSYVLVVEDWFPGSAAAGSFPDAAAGGADVVGCGVAGYPDDCRDAAGAVGADQAPAQGGVEAGVYDGRFADAARRGILLGVERVVAANMNTSTTRGVGSEAMWSSKKQ